MQTKICDMFGIDFPVVAFSHCRDVVVGVSKAGGLGVLGASGFQKEELKRELDWIESHIEGKPYGIDVLMPSAYANVRERDDHDWESLLPTGHRDFVDRLMEKYHVPALSDEERQTLRESLIRDAAITPEHAQGLLELAFSYPIKLIVNALGVPPRELVDHAHSMGIKVGAMTGKIEHALRQKDAGVDFIIAQGTEAGGHTGTIATMVLTPQIVDAVAPLPVLAAGGIASGRQMVAALALGAEGVWTGSVWLGTAESEVVPAVREKIYESRSEDAIITKSMTGKTMRGLRSKWTDEWSAPDAPEPLMMPLQTYLVSEATKRIMNYGVKDLATYPAGQVIGQMAAEKTVREVMRDFMTEFADSYERISGLI